MLSCGVLGGELVRLEPLSPDHVGPLVGAAAESRDGCRFSWVPDGLTEASRYVGAALSDHAGGHTVPFAVRSVAEDRIVGCTRFLDLQVFTWPPAWPPSVAPSVPDDDTPPTVGEIGHTWYAHSVQRTGVNTECKLLMLTHAFEVWRVVRVTLRTDARNAASRRAIERVGGRPEGVRRAHGLASDGSVRDTAYYSITSDEWPTVRDRLHHLRVDHGDRSRAR